MWTTSSTGGETHISAGAAEVRVTAAVMEEKSGMLELDDRARDAASRPAHHLLRLCRDQSGSGCGRRRGAQTGAANAAMTIHQGRSGMATKSYSIALEEHYYDSEVKRHASGLDGDRRAGNRAASPRSGRTALEGNGRGRHRPAGVVAYDAGAPEARC